MHCQTTGVQNSMIRISSDTLAIGGLPAANTLQSRIALTFPVSPHTLGRRHGFGFSRSSAFGTCFFHLFIVTRYNKLCKLTYGTLSSGGRGPLNRFVGLIDEHNAIPCSFESSHPDQFFPFQINSLQYPLVGHCFLREFFATFPYSHLKVICRTLLIEHFSGSKHVS